MKHVSWREHSRRPSRPAPSDSDLHQTLSQTLSLTHAPSVPPQELGAFVAFRPPALTADPWSKGKVQGPTSEWGKCSRLPCCFCPSSTLMWIRVQRIIFQNCFFNCFACNFFHCFVIIYSNREKFAILQHQNFGWGTNEMKIHSFFFSQCHPPEPALFKLDRINASAQACFNCNLLASDEIV